MDETSNHKPDTRAEDKGVYELQIWGGLSDKQEEALGFEDSHCQRCASFPVALDLQDRAMAEGCAKTRINYWPEGLGEGVRINIRTRYHHPYLVEKEAERLAAQRGGE